MTRKGIHVNRAATARLIRRFIDTQAEILFVEPGEVARVPAEPQTEPEAVGLWAVSQGFTDVARDDEEIAQKVAFLYDALYSHLQHEESARG